MIGHPPRRKGAFTVVALAGAVAGCTALTGAGEFFVTNGCMDCGGDDGGGAPSDAGGTTPESPSSSGGLSSRDAAYEGPPACDQENDPSCLALPGGWALVAVMDLGGGKAPECPEGFDGTKGAKIDVGEGPSPQPDTCSCDGCKVTQPAACLGPVANRFGPDCATSASSNAYANNPPNTCLPTSHTGIYAGFQQFTLSPGSGGACEADPPALHGNRVDWAKRMRLCAEISRCSGGVCDARLDPPYRACVAQDGDHPCPPAFPQRTVASEKATFDCSGTCGCSVSAACSGTISHYSDSECTTGEVKVTADGVCRATLLGGKSFAAYKVSASPNTQCAATGTATASNGRLASPITLCCR